MGSQPSRVNKVNQISQKEPANTNYFTVDHETHVSEGSEGELHTRSVICEKNPGHTKFIPVDIFTLEHLPKGHRNKYLLEYIKAVADLTVKVNVYKISSDRPEFWPETKEPYPFYNKRGTEVLNTGSGMIDDVYTFKDDKNWATSTKCWCRECKQSDSPSNVWWEFNVQTATHVVFDENEASDATLRLFYDSKDSPVVIVNNVSVVDVNIEDDYCRLKCVTCDKHLGDKLMKMYTLYKHVWWKVWKKYLSFRSVDQLTFIVSHPHGCTKQVSLGYWIKEYNKRGDEGIFRKLTYTTCTCPGSSGARVHCVGYKIKGRRWFYNFLVHSGADSELNYSSVTWFS